MIPYMRWAAGRYGARWVWLGWWLAMFVATHYPKVPSLPRDIPHADKLLHGLLYFILTLLGGRALIHEGRLRGAGTLARWAGVYLIYGCLDELLQPFINRTASLMDWTADAVGVIAATLILMGFPRGRRDNDEPRDGRDFD